MNKFLLVLAATVFTSVSWAYPEMIRHKYNSCTTCHVSPSGGGILTPYGRKLSAEVLSFKGTEKMAQPFWGALSEDEQEKLDKWVLFGGDVRGVYFNEFNTRDEWEKKVIRMQAEASVAHVAEKWGIVMTVGKLEGEDVSDPLVIHPYAPTYYGFVRPLEQLSVRAGRFLPAYGLNIPDHIAVTRGRFGFGYADQRDAVEAQWETEDYLVNATVSKQVLPVSDRETAVSAQVQYNFLDTYKVAANVMSGSTESGTKKNRYGVWGIFGFRPDFYLMSEADLVRTETSSSGVTGFVAYNKLGYTLVKGLDAIALFEVTRNDLSDVNNTYTRKGVGLQFFPIPHLEIEGVMEKMSGRSRTGKDYADHDFGWLLLHYYL